MAYSDHRPAKKINQIIFVFLVLTLVSSLSAVAFVTGNKLAFGRSSGGSSDNSGGGSSGGSSDNSGGGSSSGGSGSSGTSSTTSPPQSTEQTTPTSPPSASKQQTTCPDGSTPDANGKCPTTPAANSGGANSTSAPTLQTCPDGSSPDANGNCPAQTTTPPTEQNTSMPSLTQQTCPPLPIDANGNCPATTSSTQQNTATPCPDGSKPDANGNCPATTSSSNTTSEKSLAANTLNPTCPGGAARDANGICLSPTPVTPTCPIHTVLDATGDCVSLGVSQSITNGSLIPIADGKLRLATAPPVPNTNSIAPICPFATHLVGSKCVVNGADCGPGYVQDEDICTPTTRSLPVYPGSTTGSSGGFIQMIPTCPGGSKPDANGNCPTSTPPATSPTNTPPLQPKPKQFTSLAEGAGGGLGLPPTTIKLPTTSIDPISHACPTGYHRNSLVGTECVTNTPQCPSGYKIATSGDECFIPAPPSTPATGSTNTPTKSVTLPSYLPVFGACTGGSTKIGDRCVLGVDNCHTSGGTVTGNQCVFNTPAPATTPSTPSTTTTTPPPIPTCSGGDHIINRATNPQCAGDYFPYDDGTCAPGRIHIPGPNKDYCSIPPVLPGSTTGAGGGFIQMFPTCPGGSVGQANGTCPTSTPPATTQTGNTGASTGTTTTTGGTTTTQYVPAVDGKCPSGSHEAGGSSGNPRYPAGAGSVICRLDNPPTSTSTSTATPASTQSSNSGAGNGGGTTTTTGGTTNTTKTPMNTGTTGTGGTTTTNTGGTTSTPMTTPMKAGGGTTTTGPGTPTTTTSAKTTTTTTPPKQTGTTTSGSTGTPTSTAKATTAKIINNKNVVRGSSTSGGGTIASTSPPLITYVNTLNKITIKYPSTWTKTEFTGNPGIPVIFNAPTTITTTATGNAGPTAAAKNSFVISITPSASNLDNFTQQRINALTHSNGVKYNITNTNAKVLTAPTGITAYREVSYDATKNILVNNTTIPTQVPLKGAAIFFVNSGTGYSLLYLAKQTEYTQNLPMIQQMVNSFQIGNGGGTAARGAGVQ